MAEIENTYTTIQDVYDELEVNSFNYLNKEQVEKLASILPQMSDELRSAVTTALHISKNSAETVNSFTDICRALSSNNVNIDNRTTDSFQYVLELLNKQLDKCETPEEREKVRGYIKDTLTKQSEFSSSAADKNIDLIKWITTLIAALLLSGTGIFAVASKKTSSKRKWFK